MKTPAYVTPELLDRFRSLQGRLLRMQTLPTAIRPSNEPITSALCVTAEYVIEELGRAGRVHTTIVLPDGRMDLIRMKIDEVVLLLEIGRARVWSKGVDVWLVG